MKYGDGTLYGSTATYGQDAQATTTVVNTPTFSTETGSTVTYTKEV